MSRNNRNNNKGAKSTKPRKSTSAMTSEGATSERNLYDELFPPLSADFTTTVSSNSQISTEIQPLMSAEHKEEQVGASSVKSKPDVTQKMGHVWKPLPAPSPSIVLSNFISNSTVPKDSATNRYESTDRSVTRNFMAESETPRISDKEERIDTEICKIILKIHLRQEFVSLERVEQDLFAHYNVQSFRQLGVDRRNLKSLMKLTHRIKDVTFYMQIFEQVFNLCTLHDLDPLVAKFLNVNTYEDAHLGPIDEHPEVKRVFKYKPRKRHQPIPNITSGQIINEFLAFQNKHQRRRFDYGEFLDELAQQNQLQKREELGIFCCSFPYLTEVSRRVNQHCSRYKKQVESDAQKQVIAAVEARLWEIQCEVSSELELSSYNNKSPIAVFDHLVSVVEKYLNVSQQKSVRDALIKIRNDELLRCLLNISIYLGTIDKPEKLFAEFHKHNQTQGNESVKQNLTSISQSSESNKFIDNNQRRMEQYMLNMQNGRVNMNATDFVTDTSFGASSELSYSRKTQISMNKLCSDLFRILTRYDTVLTIKQLIDIEKHLCKQYSIKNFVELGMNNDEEIDNIPLNMISFLYINQKKIDPTGELSIYENPSSIGDRQEIYSFVNQLTIIKNWREKQQKDDHSNSKEIPLSKNQLSAVEKSIHHKFGGSLTHNHGLQIIKKAKNQYSRQTHSIIHFEESLLDEDNLNKLGICPPSLLVDESKLCQIILQCPIMTDLSIWLQWSDFFQSRHGPLKTFIARKAKEFDHLLLLETSNNELLRLPIDSSLENFEKELKKGNIQTSVGHLCALIIREHVQVNHLPFTIYRQVMNTWFIHLRSSVELQQLDNNDPMYYVLEFLTYLPALIGQVRLVQELIIEPLDEVFSNDEQNEITNPRQRIWMLANRKQKSKLEMWGYKLDIDEWKNENKWNGIDQLQQESNFQQINDESLKREIINQDAPAVVPRSIPTTPILNIPSSPLITENNILINKTTNIDENNPNSTAFEHIQKIREGFGINSSFDAAGLSVVNNLQGMITRSLEKLSNDLYSEQNHFVLELIQNADDNQYPSDCLPTLRFIVSSDCILVCNNEIGFQPNNIEAICNIGKSTKGKHKQGYTGHKGIGFKSVFMVSYCPEIHSGDYHFCFNTVNGREQIGYILPIWLENYNEFQSTINEWTTCIRLPIKEENRGDKLRRNFDDIHARLLLFLNRLRQIEIVRQKGNNNQTDIKIFTRIDHAQGKIIELQKKTTTSKELIKSFWLVTKTVIPVPDNIKKQLNDVKCDVHSTTIAIAYPLDAIHELSSYQTLPSQPLFAYLPLRSYGFHFILQGDFEIPASRQEVLRDNIWNEWLKKEMVKLFPLAYESFKNLPNILKSCSIDVQQHFGLLTTIQTLKYFIKMIPICNEIDPYFNSFIDKSIQTLMGIIQLPIIRDENNQIIEWISPTQCVIVRDSFIKQIFSQDLLLSHFNNYYLNEQFINECNQSILIKLGCKKLDFSNILKLIRTLYTQNQQEHSTKTTTIEQIAQWFLCIDYSLQQERENPGFNIDDHEQNEITTMNQLKQMKIIPLKDQIRLVSIEEFNQRTILFPLNKTTDYAKHLKLVLEDLPTIDEKLIEYIENKYPRRLESIKHLLKDLGISESRNIRRIYSNHILPIISDDIQWTIKSDSILIAYLIFIYKELYSPEPHHFANENGIEKLKEKLIIKTRQGKFIRLDSNKNNIIHLTSLYGCKISLEMLKLSSYSFTFISDDYYNQYKNDLFNHQEGEKHRFISFLNELGIQDFFFVEKVDQGFIKVEQLVGTQWSHIIKKLSSLIFEPFIIQDYRCNEIDTIITSKDNLDPDQYIQILLYLEYCYQFNLHYYIASVIRSRERHTGTLVPVQGIESSFCLSLRKHSWIPVAGKQLFKPTDVYVLPINHPFRRYVPSLDQLKVPLRNSNFIEVLGFKQKIEPMTMFELLLKWSCNLDRESLYKLIDETNTQISNIIPCTISTNFHQSCRDTIQNIRQIYTYIASDNETRNLLSRFRMWPIIFVPRTNDTGDFVFTHEVFWQDRELLITNNDITHFESSQHIVLQPYYDNDTFSKQFFTTLLQVKEEPTLDDYLILLSNIQNKKIEYIWKCIQVITRLTFEQNKQSIVKDKCVNWPFIPCLGIGNKLVTYTEKPYYPHDMDVAHLFSDLLPIIKLPDELISTYNFKQQFCSLFNIDDLTDVIKVLVDVDNPQPAIEVLGFYSHTIDLIQSFLLNNHYLSETRSYHLQAIFSDMLFLTVDSIRFSYQYQENIVRKSSTLSTLDSYIDESTRKFYILSKYENNDSPHINTMVNYLILDESARLKLLEYIKYLFKIYQDNDIQCLKQQQENLPEQTVPKWIIPQVIKKESNSSSTEESQDEEDETNNEPIIIPPEMLEAMKNEPALRLLKSNCNKIIDPNQPKSLTCFPSRAGAVDLSESSHIKHSSNSNIQLTDVVKERDATSQESLISTQNDSNSSTLISSSLTIKTSDGIDQTNNKKDNKQSNESGDKSINEANKSVPDGSHQSSQQAAASHLIPLTMADFTKTQSQINFEHIHISNFTKISLSPSTLPNPPTTASSSSSGNEIDLEIGRRGEEFVYRYLLWRYPDAKIEWVNEHHEFGQPYDIQMIRKEIDSKMDFIEVKTTRIPRQNTFQISVGEVEYLLANQNNYYIYRVYYANDEKDSTITILNQIKCHLQQKQFALSITIADKIDQQ